MRDPRKDGWPPQANLVAYSLVVGLCAAIALAPVSQRSAWLFPMPGSRSGCQQLGRFESRYGFAPPPLGLSSPCACFGQIGLWQVPGIHRGTKIPMVLCRVIFAVKGWWQARHTRPVRGTVARSALHISTE
ncbi:hypothetical protein GCM10017744_005650 [Streptomyces antimycoticus]|uniref:Uncharacterized protein n=1 Tax=Streptomyces antimycoticus TaxID=68175 RepID=A0A4D4KK26_9ACTN|nr:hypothetical protein SANT12839_094160 [Streptomyces antimycoticus]